MYESVHGGVICPGCLLSGKDSENFSTYESALDHLHEHKKAGHEIPKRAFDGLEYDIKNSEIQGYDESRKRWRQMLQNAKKRSQK